MIIDLKQLEARRTRVVDKSVEECSDQTDTKSDKSQTEQSLATSWAGPNRPKPDLMQDERDRKDPGQDWADFCYPGLNRADMG